MSNRDIEIEIKKTPKEIKFLVNDFPSNSFKIPYFNKGYGISICYANNGIGKTTICNNILNNTKFVNKKIEIFSYEKDMFIDTDNHFVVSENIKKIEETKKEINECRKIISNVLFKFFENLQCYPRTNNYKEIISTCNLYGLSLSDYKFKKNDNFNKMLPFGESDLKSFSKKINLNKTDVYLYLKNELSPDNFWKLFEEYKNFKKIDENIKQILFKDLKKFLVKILHDVEIFKKDIKELKNINKYLKYENIDCIEQIYEIIDNLENINKCFICETEIKDFEKVKKNMKNKIKIAKKKLDSVKLANKLNSFIDNIEEHFDYDDSKIEKISSILVELKKLKKSNFDLTNIEKIISEITNLKNLKSNFEKNLNNYFINIFNMIKPTFFDQYILNDKLINLINDNKINSKKRKISKYEMIEFNFIIEFIENEIGEKRLKIDKQKLSISIDDKNIGDREVMQNLSILSTGEKNFIAIAFSLFSYLNRYKKNEFDILCFDDPFSSYDSNFKFQIFHLISLFCSIKKMPIFIFTHSIDYFILAKNSIPIKKYFYILNTTKTFGDKIDTEDIKIIGIREIKINEENFLSNLDLIKWLKKIIFETNKTNIENLSIVIIIFSPLIRSLCSLLGNTSWNNCLSKIIHCNDFFDISENFKKECVDFFSFFFKKCNKDDSFWEKLVFEIFKNSNTETLQNNLQKNVNILKSFFGNEHTHLGFHLCKILLYTIFFRKKIIFFCIKNSDEKQKKYYDRKINMRNLINGNDEIKKSSKFFLNNVRLLSNEIMHQENNLNIINLALEITPRRLLFLTNKLDSIMKGWI